MADGARDLLKATNAQRVCIVEVLDFDEQSQSVRYRNNGEEAIATIATPLVQALIPGDRVVIALSDVGESLVLGVVGQTRSRMQTALRSTDGATATLTRSESGNESLQIHDAKGQLLFSYSPLENRSVVYAPSGDLEFHAAQGNIEFVAGRRVGVKAPEMHVDTTRASMRSDDARLDAKLLTTAVERVRHVAGSMELRVGELFETARVSIREVAEIAQIRARELRLLARDAWHARGGRTVLAAEEEMRLKGSQIHIA